MNNTNQTDATVLTKVQQAIAAAQAGNKPLARLHLENAVTTEHQNPNYWVWLAWTAESPTSTISALQHALSLDPEHTIAQQGLTWALAMRDLDPNSYEEFVADETQPESDQQPVEQEQNVADELPEEEFTEVEPVAEQPEEHPEPTPAEQEEAVSEIVETEEVDEPLIVEPTDELEADEESVEEAPVEPSNVQEELADAEPLEAEPEPLEAELVDVSDIDTEDLVSSDDGESEVPATDGPVTVLAVDDSPTIRKIVSMSLEGVGYNVVTAADGMEAMQVLPKCNPSLILTDISMPKIDGYQLCKLIKAHEKTKSIPVIMLSGKDGMFDKIKGKFVGCDDYITKPFQSSELLEKVSSYLPTPVSDS